MRKIMMLLTALALFACQDPPGEIADEPTDPVEPVEPDFPEVEPVPTDAPDAAPSAADAGTPEPDAAPSAADAAPSGCTAGATVDLGPGSKPDIAGNSHGFAIANWTTPPGAFAQLERRVVEPDGSPYSVVDSFLAADYPVAYDLAGDEGGYVITTVGGASPLSQLQNFFFMTWDGTGDGNLLNQENRAYARVADGDNGQAFWSEYASGCYHLMKGSLDADGTSSVSTVTDLACEPLSELPGWEMNHAVADDSGTTAVGIVRENEDGFDKARVILVQPTSYAVVELGQIAHDPPGGPGGDNTFVYISSLVTTNAGFAALWSKGDFGITHPTSWEIEEHLTLFGTDGTITGDVLLEDISEVYWRHELAWNGTGFGLVSNHAWSGETVFRRLEGDGMITETIPLLAPDMRNEIPAMAASGPTYGIVRMNAAGNLVFITVTCY